VYSAPMKLDAITNATRATTTLDTSSAVVTTSLNGVGATLNSANVGSGMVHSSAVPPVSRQSCSYLSWLSTHSWWDCSYERCATASCSPVTGDKASLTTS
jgi:hypothetical protein